jgi:hypothetical protein
MAILTMLLKPSPQTRMAGRLKPTLTHVMHGTGLPICLIMPIGSVRGYIRKQQLQAKYGSGAGASRLMTSTFRPPCISAIDLHYLRNFLRQFAEASGTGSSAFALSTARGDRKPRKKGQLLDPLWELKKCQYTDTRDKVFATLGHATDIPAGSISVDYTKELVDVYTYVVRFALGHDRIGLSILEAVFIPAPDSKNRFLSAVLSPQCRRGSRTGEDV